MVKEIVPYELHNAMSLYSPYQAMFAPKHSILGILPNLKIAFSFKMQL